MPADDSGNITPADANSGVTIDVAQPALLRGGVERILPWLASLAVNLTLLILLALLSVSGMLEQLRIPLEVSALFNSESEPAAIDLPEIGAASSESATTSELEIPQTDSPDDPRPNDTAIEDLNPDLLRSFSQETSPTGLNTSLLEKPVGRKSRPGILGLPNSAELATLVPTTTARGPLLEHELKERTSLRDVALDVGDEIRDKLSKDSLLVVWLMDASISMVDNRQELAAHLDIFYANLEQQTAAAKGQKKKLLMNSVVAFGNGAQGISAPYRVPTKATMAMRQMGVDPSGVETTCQAIVWTVMQARANWSEHRGQLMIVVFTDESGDDLGLLEETIEVCRMYKASVSIIGPSAILGTDEGFHRWKHPQVALPFWLPVVKGPDTALPERLRLPYWWSTENLRTRLNLPPQAMEFPTDREIAAEWKAKLPAWAQGAEVNPADYFAGSYSGRELLNLNSGFPPWGLMRLARETGGTYTMFDRHGDRGPFRLSLMRPYAPDYRSLPEIVEELRYHPMRVAILNSAILTRKYAPRTTPSIGFWRGHVEPEQFRVYCNKEFPRCDVQADETAKMIEVALAGFGANGMEAEYERENSPRWQAWYDLVVGRLLLQSVRFAEYRMTLRLLDDPRIFPNKANQINLFPFATIRAGELSFMRAIEGQRLLQRCLDKNPGTPWAFLAARELEHPLSVDFNWRYIPPPPPSPPSMPGPPGSPAPQIILPNL